MHLNPLIAAAADLRAVEPHPTTPTSSPGEIPQGSLLDRYTAHRSAARASRSILSTSDTTSISRKAGIEHNEE